MVKKLYIIIAVFFYINIFPSEMKMVLQGITDGNISKIAFSDDSKIFATTTSMSNTIKIWSITGRFIKAINCHRTISTGRIVISPNKKFLAVNTAEQSILIYNLLTLEVIELKTETPYRGFGVFDFTGDNSNIVAAVMLNVGTTGVTPEFDYKTFQDDILPKLNEEERKKVLNSYSYDEKTKLYRLKFDLDDYMNLILILDKAGYRRPDSMMHDLRNIIEVWSVEGEFVKQVGTQNRNSQNTISELIVSEDGSRIMSFSYDGNIKIWDFNGKILSDFKSDSPYGISSIDFSSDNKLIAWTSYQGLKVVNTNGIFLMNENLIKISSLDIDQKLYAHADVKVLGQNDYHHIIKLKEIGGNYIMESKKLPNTPAILKISPNGKYIVAGGMDGSVYLINTAAGEVVSMISKDDDWLTFTEDGYFSGSINGGALIKMVKGFDIFSIDQFAIKLNRPDIILKRLGSNDKGMIKHYNMQYQKRLKKLKVNESDFANDFHVPEAKIEKISQYDKIVEVRFTLNDSLYKIKSYNIYVNDVPVFGAYGKQVDGNNLSIKEEIELIGGNNKIEVTCINEKGAESFRQEELIKYDKEIKGDLYYIGFGISDYEDSKITDLSYAHQDAIDLADMFNSLKYGYNNVKTYMYLNERGNLDNIKRVKSLLSNAKVDDTVVLFIAGHGVHDTDEESTYYYVTHDAKLDDISKRGAKFDIIEDILQGIAPRKKLFLMDTCESGEVDNEVADSYYETSNSRGIKARTIRRGLKKIATVTDDKRGLTVNTGDNRALVSGGKSKRIYLYERDRYIYNDLLRRSGAIVFSSSKGGEFSYEDDKFKNGLFTEEVINAFMKKKADFNSDNVISIDELKKYVSKAVGELSRSLQNPTVDRDNLYQKIDFKLK